MVTNEGSKEIEGHGTLTPQVQKPLCLSWLILSDSAVIVTNEAQNFGGVIQVCIKLVDNSTKANVLETYAQDVRFPCP